MKNIQDTDGEDKKQSMTVTVRDTERSFSIGLIADPEKRIENCGEAISEAILSG